MRLIGNQNQSRAAVLTIILYGSETWTIYRRHGRQLQHFHLRYFRIILNIRWQDKIPDTEVLQRAEITLRMAQTRSAGHVSRMQDSRIPKQLIYGKLSQGKRKTSTLTSQHGRAQPPTDRPSEALPTRAIRSSKNKHRQGKTQDAKGTS